MLKMFFKDLSKPLYGLEIAQALRASPGTIHRELSAMAEQKIVKKQKEGALVMFRINLHHPYFSELKRSLFPTPKKTSRVLLMGGLHLSMRTPADHIADFELFLEYAKENASEIVFLGDMLVTDEGLQVFLHHKAIFDRVTELAHHLSVTYLLGKSEKTLTPLIGGKCFDAAIHFASSTYHSKLNLLSAPEAPHQDLKKYSYVVIAGAEKSALKKMDGGIYISPGSWKTDKKRNFAEVDKEGAALISVSQLR